MTMETNMLKEIVLPPTLMRKLLSAAGVSSYVDILFLDHPLWLGVRNCLMPQLTSSRICSIHRTNTVA